MMTQARTFQPRIFQHHHLWVLPQPTFTAAADLLIDAAEAQHGEFSAVVAIAHGGLALADRAAQRVSTPSYQVRARHNLTGAIYEEATGNLTCDTTKVGEALDGAHLQGTVLLVDDICGTSATLSLVSDRLRSFMTPDATIVTATLCLNGGAAAAPDVWLWNVNDWVIFPWEAPPDATLPTRELPMPTQAHTS